MPPNMASLIDLPGHSQWNLAAIHMRVAELGNHEEQTVGALVVGQKRFQSKIGYRKFFLIEISDQKAAVALSSTGHKPFFEAEV